MAVTIDPKIADEVLNFVILLSVLEDPSELRATPLQLGVAEELIMDGLSALEVMTQSGASPSFRELVLAAGNSHPHSMEVRLGELHSEGRLRRWIGTGSKERK